MGKSFIKNVLKNDLANLDSFRSVNDWTKKEWDRLSHISKFPICIKLANGDYRVSSYKIQKNIATRWVVYNKFNETIAEFATDSAAVVFCIALHEGKYIEARYLEILDAKVTKLKQDRLLFSRLLTSAYEKCDGWLIDLYTSRYSNNNAHLFSAQNELTKFVLRTKYIKSYRNDYET